MNDLQLNHLARTITMRSINQTLLCAFSVFLFLACQTFAEEKAVIDFNASAFQDPFLEIFQPTGGNGDQLFASNDALEIKQYADKPKQTTSSTGMKILFPAHGNFSIELKLSCLKLSPPKDGWGQGLFMSAQLADSSKTTFNLGYVAIPFSDKRLFISEIKNGQTDKVIKQKSQDVSVLKDAVLDGSLLIRREASVVTFQLLNRGMEPLKCEFETEDFDVASFGIWATRLPKGNTETHFRLNKLELIADSFSPIVTPPEGINWWTYSIIGQVLVLAGLAVYMFKARAAD